jgi:hypothetical protein
MGRRWRCGILAVAQIVVRAESGAVRIWADDGGEVVKADTGGARRWADEGGDAVFCPASK